MLLIIMLYPLLDILVLFRLILLALRVLDNAVKSPH